ncbi:MAG: hypothetical protein F6K56_04055 [Moorea sp. SIO3G5]|nr:hypothetical protein [Moorena sp. SIO3G5]
MIQAAKAVVVNFCLLPLAYGLLPIASCMQASCLLPLASCLLPLASCLLPFFFGSSQGKLELLRNL